jgi:hypothetical protein
MILHEKFAEVLRENKELKAKSHKKPSRPTGSSREQSVDDAKSDASNSSFTLDSTRSNHFRIKSGTQMASPRSKMLQQQYKLSYHFFNKLESDPILNKIFLEEDL